MLGMRIKYLMEQNQRNKEGCPSLAYGAGLENQ